MAIKKIDEETGAFIIDRYNKGATIVSILNELNNSVSRDTVKKFLREKGIYRERKYWGYYTKEECEIIGRLYQEGEWDKIFNKFPLISKDTVYVMCSELGFKKTNHFWSEEDTQYLLDNYGKMPFGKLAEYFYPKYTYCAVQSKADRLGITKSRFWTDEENNILINNYSNVTMEEMNVLLPNRTTEAIVTRAKELGIKSFNYLNEKYTNEQKQYIIDNWKSMTDEEIGNVLNKTAHGIRDQRARLGLCRVNKQYAKYENLAKLFRGHIQKWKLASMEKCNYQCVITGSKDYAIHHLYGFNKILEEAFGLIECEIELISDNTTDYTKAQLDRMITIFESVHDKYPLGVCIRKDIHDLFHEIYGAGGNTEEQWNIFIKVFVNGKYKDRIAI